MDRKTLLERAFELAESGQFSTVEDIRRVLDAEGYYGREVAGRQLVQQLRGLMKDSARKPQPRASQ